MDDHDLVFQVRTHLLYELKWMILAATEFGPDSGNAHVALIDSAAVHARNLLEFAKLDKRGDQFTLTALGGIAGERKEWERFLNNRVIHMHSREKERRGWPSDLDNDRPDRLFVMASDVLDLLESNGSTIPNGPVREAYDNVLAAARTYLTDPSETTHAALVSLYDDSRDNRPYA